jgi:hypothetical protein
MLFGVLLERVEFSPGGVFVGVVHGLGVCGCVGGCVLVWLGV